MGFGLYGPYFLCICGTSLPFSFWFLRAIALPAGTAAEARISYGDFVRLSVRLSRPGAETTE